MKPERLMSCPPGCQIILGDVKAGVYRYEWGYGSPRGFIQTVTTPRTAENYPVLAPSADNGYGLLPWDIPMRKGYEPDGAWEKSVDWDAGLPAYRIVRSGDMFLTTGGEVITAIMDYDFSGLHVRRIKTKRTVIEVEVPTTHAPCLQAGDEIRLISTKWTTAYDAAVVAVREVER